MTKQEYRQKVEDEVYWVLEELLKQPEDCTSITTTSYAKKIVGIVYDELVSLYEEIPGFPVTDKNRAIPGNGGVSKPDQGAGVEKVFRYDEPKYSGWYCPHGDCQIMMASQKDIDEHNKESHSQPTKDSREEQCFCKSYYDDNNVLRDCTCGKCALKTKQKEKEK